jgi:hypothetical protein
MWLPGWFDIATRLFRSITWFLNMANGLIWHSYQIIQINYQIFKCSYQLCGWFDTLNICFMRNCQIFCCIYRVNLTHLLILEQWSDFSNQLSVRFNTPTHFSAITRFSKSVISLILHSYQVIESNCQIFYINNQVDLIYPTDFLRVDIF